MMQATGGVAVPVIETERLRLRGHTLADFADSAAMWAEDAVTRLLGGRPLTEEEVWTRLLRYVGHWALQGYGYWWWKRRRRAGSSARPVSRTGGVDQH